MTRKRVFLFQLSHAVKYALRVTRKSSGNPSELLTCEFRFCVSFERRYKGGYTRQKSANIKYFPKPSCWKLQTTTPEAALKEIKEYWNLGGDSKKTFSDQVVAVKQILLANFGASQVCQQFQIIATTLHVVVGEILSDSKKINGKAE